MGIKRSKKLITGLFLLVLPVLVSAASINLRVGEVKTLRPGAIDRVAVGNAEMLSTSLLKNGQLLVFGEAEGVSSLRVWLLDGKEIHYEVFVEGFEFLHSRGVGSLKTKLKEIEDIMAPVTGIFVEKIGSRIALSGRYGSEFIPMLEQVKGAYPEILDLTISTKYSEVMAIIGGTPGMNIKLVGDRIVLTGTVDDGVGVALESLAGAYPEILDLTVKDQLQIDSKLMVLMNIKITEFRTNTLDELGILWGGVDGTVGLFNGPAGAFASERSSGRADNAGFSVTGNPFSGDQFATGPVGARQSFGYFGIATEIVSRINLAVATGDAVILASPRLVARSGGEADFLAGGEIPIEIVTPTSAAVEFKEFGILLNIQPEVDLNGNIMATVQTEISAVDNSVTVGGVPGFLTRRTSADISMSSGETLVMSGLINQEISEDISGLKGLSSIPILGRLFRS
ncbi:MAG: pilus assembly protein N-terminal domain-containing protein, partial [Pseudomonadota bacterium]